MNIMKNLKRIINKIVRLIKDDIIEDIPKTICTDCENYVIVELFKRTPIFCNLPKKPYRDIYCLCGVDVMFNYYGERIVTCNKFKRKRQ